MNPINFAARVLRDVYGDRLTDPDAAAAEPEPVTREVAQPNPYRAEPAEDLSPWEFTRADEVAEGLVVQRLAVETARVGSSWEAARRLFAPNTPCAGLYATQTPPERPSRVSVSPDAHRPARPLP